MLYLPTAFLGKEIRGKEAEKSEKAALQPCRGWRGAGVPLGGAREPRFAPRGCLHLPGSAGERGGGWGGGTAFSSLCLSLRNKHLLPLEIQFGNAGIYFTAFYQPAQK